jgi:hypothetical protein
MPFLRIAAQRLLSDASYGALARRLLTLAGADQAGLDSGQRLAATITGKRAD